MFSKEESQQLRKHFWISFGKSFPRKWILYNTKLKGLVFKFHFDTKKAFVSMDIETDFDQRVLYWEKITSLKSIITEEFLPEAVFDEEYVLENGKDISRVYVSLDKKVSIHNKNSWGDVMEFFNTTMPLFEAFFEDYKDFLEL